MYRRRSFDNVVGMLLCFVADDEDSTLSIRQRPYVLSQFPLALWSVRVRISLEVEPLALSCPQHGVELRAGERLNEFRLSSDCHGASPISARTRLTRRQVVGRDSRASPTLASILQ